MRSRTWTDHPCFVHVGTHKTGTTSLQHWLESNAALLETQGFYVPRSGFWKLPGHHNVAFQLSADERFDPSRGTLADLCAELRAKQPRAACISSEIFGFIHDRIDKLEELRGALASAGYRPIIVLYLRSQAEYLESLYGTLVNHAYAVPFSQFLASILAKGVVGHGPVRSYCFDYAALVNSYARVFGQENMLVRAYPSSAAGIVSDFAEAVGLGTGIGATAADQARMNSRVFLSHLARTFLTNSGREAGGSILELIAACEALPGEGRQLVFAPLTARQCSLVRTRFFAGNRCVRERYGADVAPASDAFISARSASQDAYQSRLTQSVLAALESIAVNR